MNKELSTEETQEGAQTQHSSHTKVLTREGAQTQHSSHEGVNTEKILVPAGR